MIKDRAAGKADQGIEAVRLLEGSHQLQIGLYQITGTVAVVATKPAEITEAVGDIGQIHPLLEIGNTMTGLCKIEIRTDTTLIMIDIIIKDKWAPIMVDSSSMAIVTTMLMVNGSTVEVAMVEDDFKAEAAEELGVIIETTREMYVLPVDRLTILLEIAQIIQETRAAKGITIMQTPDRISGRVVHKPVKYCPAMRYSIYKHISIKFAEYIQTC